MCDDTFSGTVMNLIELHLATGTEKDRLTLLTMLKERITRRYEYEIADPMKELDDAIAIAKTNQVHIDDLRELNKIRNLLREKKFVKAVKLYENVDTFVREYMPKKTYTWMYHEFEKKRT
jgi:hypothetical protein